MIKVLIADDHELVRKAVRSLLTDYPGLSVIAEAVSGEEAVKLSRELGPDLVLMDLDMPGMGGLEATKKLLRILPKIKVLIITAYSDDMYPSRLLNAGASGFITKEAGRDELAQAIKVVWQGQRYISPEVAKRLALMHLDQDKDKESPFAGLSERELQILLMIVKGDSLQHIAKQLYLSPKTVSSYRHNIFKKLDVTSDVEVTLLAVSHGLVDADSI